jgi:hypothetical protein
MMAARSTITFTATAAKTATMVLCLLSTGCPGDNPILPDGGSDFNLSADLIICNADNDGKIALSELLFDRTGLSVDYRFNPPGTLVPVDVVGEVVDGQPTWEFTQTDGVVAPVTTEDPRDFWFSSNFKSATLVVPTDAAGNSLQVLELDQQQNRLMLLGLASRKKDETLLVYEEPVELMRFPLQAGQRFESTGEVKNGVLDGVPIATRDTYRVHVDQEGTVVLPSLRFSRSLRMRVLVISKAVGGVEARTLQYQWFHECFGEIARVVAQPTTDGSDPQDPPVEAREFRRVSF